MEDSITPSDAKLDETIEESFPASDAPANTVETGIRSGEVASSGDADADTGANEEAQPEAPHARRR